MSDDSKLDFRSKLDLLLSIHAADFTTVELAEALFATANGLVTLAGPRPRWFAEQRALEVPFTEAVELEGSLEALLSTRILCLPVDGVVPMLTDITVRVRAGASSVDLTGRAVQATVAGVVIQLQPSSLDAQRALVGLPAVLRSNPTQPLRVDKKTVRLPALIPADDATDELFGKPEPVAPPPPVVASFEQPVPTIIHAPPVPHVVSAVPEPVSASRTNLGVGRSQVVGLSSGAHQAPQAEADDRLRASRLAFNLPKVDAAVARIGQRSHFDFLAVHFSADLEEVTRARTELLEIVRLCREDDLAGDLDQRLDRLVARVHEAWSTLSSARDRRNHREEVVGAFQLETAIEMYDRQADAAKLSRRIDVAIDCYRRLVELQPSNYNASQQLEIMKSMDAG